MAKFTTRRLIENAVRLVGRASEDYAQELQEWLEKLWRQSTGSIPPGFNDTISPTISPNTTPTAGTEEAGWVAADAIPPLDLLLTTKGDLLTKDSALYARKAQDAVADGSPLLKDSAQPTGMRWGPVGETDQLILSVKAFSPHPERIPQIQAGPNITITYNALGPVIESTGGTVDSDQNILANQVFGG